MEKELMCKICNQVVADHGESSIACDWCDSWCHSSCVKIPKAVFKFLSEARDVGKCGAYKWLCPTCSQQGINSRPPFQKLVNTQSEHQLRINNLEIQVTKLMAISSNQPDMSVGECSSSSFGKVKLQPGIAQDLSKISYAKVVVKGAKTTSNKPSCKFKPFTQQVRAKPTEVMVLKRNVNTPLADKVQLKKLKELVSNSLARVEMCFLKVNDSSGEMSIGFPNQENKVEAEKYLIDIQDVSDDAKNLESRQSDQLIKQKTILKEVIMQKSVELSNLCDLGHTFDIVYVKKLKGYFNIGIKVSPTIRDWILKRGFLFIGNGCCPALDRLIVKQCYHCQRIGHVSNQCPSKSEPPTCLYCMGRHRSATCPNKSDPASFKCSNCANTKLYSEKSCGHSANSYDCPFLQQELAKLQNTIDYT